MQVTMTVAVRNKMLGALLRHARLRAGRPIEDYAAVFKRPVEEILAWERGDKGVTLSELEAWAYVSGMPVSFFWDESALPTPPAIQQPLDKMLSIRRKMIGVLLQQSRLIAGRSIEEVAAIAGASPELMQSAEAGTQELSAAQLELAAEACGVPISDFLDDSLFPLSEEERRARDMQKLNDLPPDLRDFVLKPSNVLYLKIAMQLSALSADTLRDIAETILDITF